MCTTAIDSSTTAEVHGLLNTFVVYKNVPINTREYMGHNSIRALAQPNFFLLHFCAHK